MFFFCSTASAHSAATDAFATGFVFAAYGGERGQIGDSSAHMLYLTGKDFPLVVNSGGGASNQ